MVVDYRGPRLLQPLFEEWSLPIFERVISIEFLKPETALISELKHLPELEYAQWPLGTLPPEALDQIRHQYPGRIWVEVYSRYATLEATIESIKPIPLEGRSEPVKLERHRDYQAESIEVLSPIPLHFDSTRAFFQACAIRRIWLVPEGSDPPQLNSTIYQLHGGHSASRKMPDRSADMKKTRSLNRGTGFLR